jgi:hypothetical protein
MSYCSIEEAFQTNSYDSVLPPMRSQLENPGSSGEKGRLKPRRVKRSNLPPQEPSVIEPDRPAHRPRSDAELLGGAPERNDTTTSISSYLIGTADPAEDYFPYPNGGGDEPGFDKQFMLEPNWYEQFQSRTPSAETPPLPGASVDGHSTLYQRVPQHDRKTTTYGTDMLRNMVAKAERPQVSFAAAAAAGGDPDLQKRINELYNKIDQLEIGRSESNHIEIILFVMTGIFVLLLLDLLLKQGARAIGSIATAAAVPMLRMGGAGGGYGGGFNHPFFF